MKLIQTLRFLFIATFLLSSCKDFIEPSIINRKIFLLGPVDSLKTNIYAQSFWWEPVEDALTYRLQVVTNSFDSVGRLVVDTLVQTNKYAVSLNPGKYEWRVKAENGSSETLFSKRALTVFESSLKNQQVQLKSPGSNFLTNSNKVSLKWESIFGADTYHVQIDTLNNFTDSAKLYYNTSVNASSVEFANLKEATYKWRIRAENAKEVSQWSAVNNFAVDFTPPVKVLLASPATNTNASQPVSLKWNATATTKLYELSVYKSDSTLYNSTFPITTSQTTYNLTIGTVGEKILWKVRAKDEAGNWSAYSETRNFTIQ
ncbi:MAG: hypothetical protein JWQ25_2461 [Daejeonella sp.]|nr:hypothetical protein [Daejeonella sp.]